MSVFILEDNIYQAQHLKEMVESICEEQGIDVDRLLVTSRSEDLLNHIHSASRTPIYFLDIELKGEERKGLEVAQEIRQVDEQGIIVFVTTHAELAPISYQYMVSALTFIDKGWPYEKQRETAAACLVQYNKRNDLSGNADNFLLETEQAIVRIPFNELEYIMTDGPHRLAVITSSRVIQYYGTMKEASAVDNRLIRCHQSYVVNLENVIGYQGSNRLLIMKSGRQVPVSRRLHRLVSQRVKGENG